MAVRTPVPNSTFPLKAVILPSGSIAIQSSSQSDTSPQAASRRPDPALPADLLLSEFCLGSAISPPFQITTPPRASQLVVSASASHNDKDFHPALLGFGCRWDGESSITTRLL